MFFACWIVVVLCLNLSLFERFSLDVLASVSFGLVCPEV